MKTKLKPETLKAERAAGGTALRRADDGRVLVDSVGLAVALGVSLRTVRRMLAAEEIKPIWVRGAQRFHIPDVVDSLRAQSRTWGRRAGLTAKSAEGGAE